MRSSGILFPIFSLPGKYGIGCFSEHAYAFVDFLEQAGQTYWQILPVGPTGYGDSPYQAFSTFAGNPYFISLETLIEKELLTEQECEAAGLTDVPMPGIGSYIDYGKQYTGRFPLLHKAYERSREGGYSCRDSYRQFLKENAYWLDDYAMFMAIKNARGGESMHGWEEAIRLRESEILAGIKEELEEEIDFYRFLQYEFLMEWKQLRSYANARGIRMIGDIPIYVSDDSADFWAHPELFQVDERGSIRKIAGVPPDGFSADGQLWGNPLYEWSHHEQERYDWWIRRIGKCRELYDVIRLDHFRGFDECFAIDAGEKTAANGTWQKGPGMKLFRALHERYPDLRIIAEDLGYVTDTVRQLVRETGYPNMKVLEFAFDSRDSTGRMEYLPYRYRPNCVVYTGTHDNETLAGWLESILPEEKQEVKEYLDVRSEDPAEYVGKMIKAAHACVADTCIIPLQDYLALDNRARINQPSTFGKNWTWRADPSALTGSLAEKIRRMTRLYGREREGNTK